MDKEVATVDLISLRGGLSLISKYTDEIKAEEKNKEKCEKRKASARLTGLETARSARTARDALAQRRYEFNEAKREFDSFNISAGKSKEPIEEDARRSVEARAPKYDKYFELIIGECDIDYDLFPNFYDDFKYKAKTWLKIFGTCYVLLIIAELFFIRSLAAEIIVGCILGAPVVLPLALTILLPFIRLFLRVLNPFVNYVVTPVVNIIAKGIYAGIVFPMQKLIFKMRYASRVKAEIVAMPQKLAEKNKFLEDRLNSASEALKKAEEEAENYRSYTLEMDERIENINLEIEQSDRRIAELAQKSKALVRTLNDTYGVTIDRSDWENIDVILHYLMTGRADTLKEALQQLDRQKQTNQIIGAIKSAEEAICGHIGNALSRLGQALAASFSEMDKRLRSISGEMHYAGQLVGQKLDSQIGLHEMNAVLLEKSNSTSEELIRDLEYNQSYWENKNRS